MFRVYLYRSRHLLIYGFRRRLWQLGGGRRLVLLCGFYLYTGLLRPILLAFCCTSTSTSVTFNLPSVMLQS